MIRPTETETSQWKECGYLVFENAIQGEELKRLQEVFDYWAERCKLAWLDRVDAGQVPASFYDIPDPFDKDEIFVDLIDRQITTVTFWLLRTTISFYSDHRSARFRPVRFVIRVGTPMYLIAIPCISRFKFT